jgi:hypothetical protein
MCEVRKGELLGPPKPGTRTDLQPLSGEKEVELDDMEKHKFRQLAENKVNVPKKIAKKNEFGLRLSD